MAAQLRARCPDCGYSVKVLTSGALCVHKNGAANCVGSHQAAPGRTLTLVQHPAVPPPTKCARDGCSKDVQRVARLHGDPYCSTNCFRADYGTMTNAEADDSHRRSESASEAGPTAWRRFSPVTHSQRGRNPSPS